MLLVALIVISRHILKLKSSLLVYFLYFLQFSWLIQQYRHANLMYLFII